MISSAPCPPWFSLLSLKNPFQGHSQIAGFYWIFFSFLKKNRKCIQHVLDHHSPWDSLFLGQHRKNKSLVPLGLPLGKPGFSVGTFSLRGCCYKGTGDLYCWESMWAGRCSWAVEEGQCGRSIGKSDGVKDLCSRMDSKQLDLPFWIRTRFLEHDFGSRVVSEFSGLWAAMSKKISSQWWNVLCVLCRMWQPLATCGQYNWDPEFSI